jgi:outer membrane protein
MRFLRVIFLLVCLATQAAAVPHADAPKLLRIGYFEPGEYDYNSLMREAIHHELDKLAPSDLTIIFVPSGFRSAAWHRDSSRIMARELVANKNLDLILAAGPWSVQDLLAAGCTIPIVGFNQLEPDAGGLLSSDGRPIAPNLTVEVSSGRLESDLSVIRSLIHVKRLGVLAFEDPDAKNHLVDSLRTLAGHYNIEVVTASGFNAWGTYAFFKSYTELDRKIDALYISPLWGLDQSAANDFLAMVSRDHIPLFVGSDRTLVSRGAFASAIGNTPMESARFNAEKILRIAAGAKPVDLPVSIFGAVALSVNEAAMKECRIELPDNALADAYVIPAPVDPTTPHFTLADAVARALEQNPGYLAQYQALDSASAAATRVLSTLLPRVNAYASATHADANSVHNNFDEIKPDAYSSGVTLDATLFSLSAIRSVQLNARRVDAARTGVDNAAVEIASGVTTAYLNYLKANELAAVATLKRSIIDELLGVARSQLPFGNGDTLETLKWEQERVRAAMEFADADNNIRVARVLLNVLLNRSGDDPLTLDPGSYSNEALLADWSRLNRLMPTAGRTSTVQDFLTREAIANNPRVRSVDVEIESQKLRLDRNWARYFPTLGIHAGYNLIDSLADRSPEFAPKHHTWSLGASLNLPLFEGGQRVRERQRLRAELNALEYRRDDVRLQAMGQVQAAIYQLKSAGNAAEMATQLYEVSSNTLNRARDGYDIGTQTFTEAVTALDKHISARESEIASRYGYFGYQMALLKIVGWSPTALATTPGALLYGKLAAEYGTPEK